MVGKPEKEEALLHLLVVLFWIVVIFIAVTYLIFRLDLDGKALHFLEPIVHKVLKHDKKWTL